MIIADDRSFLARFDDEKVWVGWEVTRVVPATKSRKQTALRAVIREVRSDWAYRTLEAAHDSVVEFKLEESGDETRNVFRIRSLRNVTAFDSRWMPLKVRENFEVTLEK